MHISSLSFIACFLGAVVGYYVDAPPQYLFIVLLIAIVFGTNIISAKFFSSFITTIVFSIVTPIWYCVGIVLLGGGFAEAAGVITNLGFITIFFREETKWRYSLMAYEIIIVVIAMAYRDIVGAIAPFNNIFDDIICLITCIYWLFLIFAVYRNEIAELIDHLEFKNAELKTATEQLEQFNHMASHDLKVPLRNIHSFLGLIEMKAKQGNLEEINEYLDFAKQGSERMYVLINDMLEVSKVSNGLNQNRELVDLNNLTNEKANELLAIYPNANINIRKLPIIECNKNEWGLIFQNLMHNGLKYNSSDAQMIRIWYHKMEDRLHIYIKDNGIGIEEIYQDQIFQYFKRLHTNDEFEGTGIGLGLTKRIIESYKGTIEVFESGAKGTTFRIALPTNNKQSVYSINGQKASTEKISATAETS